MIRIVYITVLLCCQLLGNNKTEASVSFEYWLSEEFKLFSFENAFLLQIDDDTINFIINTLNQLNIDLLRNKLLLKVLPLKV